MTLRLLLAALAFVAAPLAALEPPGSAPNIAAAVAMTDRPADAVKLDAGRRPVEVLKFLGLRRGDQVLDVMAGSGYYSEIIGRAIGPNGTVTALEPPAFLAQPGSIDAWKALSVRAPSVKLTAALPADAYLAPGSFDFVLMHLTYHDTYWASEKYKFPRMDPAAFLRTVYASVRPGGIVGVVDHIAVPGGDVRKTVDALHRIDPEVVKADFARAGFVLEAESTLLRNPNDDHSKLVFDPAIRGQTDRVVFRFRKPGGMVVPAAR